VPLESLGCRSRSDRRSRKPEATKNLPSSKGTRILVLGALLLSALPVPAAATTIPLDTDSGSPPFIRARVGGSSFWFLLDTGSPSSFGRRQAQALKLPGGSSLRGIPIDLPGRTVTLPSLPLADLDPRQIALGHKLDGVLGTEFFARFVATFDFEGKTLTLENPKTNRRPGRGRALPLIVENGRPYVSARVTPRGGKPVDGNFLIDTADDTAVTFFSSFAEQHHLAGPPPPVPAGSSGAMQAVLRGETLKLGGESLREPILALSASTTGLFSDTRHAGLFGMDVLRRFTLTLDPARKRLFLEKNAAFPESFDYDASGLHVQPQGADLTTLEVRRVRPGSPGAEAGIRAGDVILAVDSRPIAEITPFGVRGLFRKDGKEYALSILREGTIRKFQLRCRRQI
jgi:PDZ domain